MMERFTANYIAQKKATWTLYLDEWWEVVVKNTNLTGEKYQFFLRRLKKLIQEMVVGNNTLDALWCWQIGKFPIAEKKPPVLWKSLRDCTLKIVRFSFQA